MPGIGQEPRHQPTTRRAVRLVACLVPTLSSVAVAWLFMAASTALADGGPHIADSNSGSSTLTADSCAICHRAHTAQGAYLIKAASVSQLCLTCHGSAGVGATTDVATGIQYKTAVAPGGSGQNAADASVVAGALRSGGFVDARIDSANPTRISYPYYDGTLGRIVANFSAKVPVLAAGQPVTSAHLKVSGATGVAPRNRAWGNIASGFSATTYAGPTVELECISCHNPHGNGHYRILNPIPSLVSTGADAFAPTTTEADMTDAALPATGQTRNYTVKPGLLVTDVSGTPPTDGDYWRRREPWDWVPTYNPALPGIVPAPSGGGHQGDRPNNLTTFGGEISAWCSTCHTRYLAGGTASTTSSGDAVYTYRHATTAVVPCTQCHVAHGSNAVMSGENSGAFPYPDETLSASSRLLKVDERGTCQQCHDPTGTEPYYPTTIRP